LPSLLQRRCSPEDCNSVKS